MKSSSITLDAPATVSRYEFACIIKIANRASELAYRLEILYPFQTILLDLENAHRQMPLDLAALLAFGERDFAHDLLGIRQHMDRRTGELGECFVPRSALSS